MLVKILLKIWPALTPVLIYICWQLLIKKLINKVFRNKLTLNQLNSLDKENYNKKNKIIDAQSEEIVGQSTTLNNNFIKSNKIFSLDNKNFLVIIYVSLIIAIFCILSLAF